jgi:glycosyltransferase involved in cell wall biosynthesis
LDDSQLLKVAQVCARYSPYIGGIETHVMMISQWIKSQNVEIEVLSTDPSRKLDSTGVVNGIQVRRFASIAPGDAYYFSPGLHDFLSKHSNDYDIVHAHGYATFPALYAALTKNTNKLIFTPHYHKTGHTTLRRLLHIPYKILGNSIFKKSDAVICVSGYERDLVLDSFKGIEAKTTIIPNGLNLEEFHKLKRTKALHKKILYVGRLERYKRVDQIIRSLQCLDSEVSLQIVGSGPDRNRLLSLIAGLGFQKRVAVSNNLERSDLLKLYSDADVFVCLSKHEAYGIAVSEALAAGIPCVVANTSALSEFVDERNCFGVSNPENPQGVAHAILKAMEVETVEFDAVSWEQVANSMLGAYERVILA